jgi:hypothetical protein
MPRQIRRLVPDGLPLELLQFLRSVPDSIATLSLEALKLNSRLKGSLTQAELQLLYVAHRELSVHGLIISGFVDPSELRALSCGMSFGTSRVFLTQRNQVITVEFNPSVLNMILRSQSAALTKMDYL